ncbi:MAG: hypothetical protein M1834_000586 [Cirrosporium novae-zelandiae]|nr:MAG: hypothetical protein M1834_000586 [Cirrosporium novae-zelandiae]
MELPQLPVSLPDFIPYIAQNADSNTSIATAVEPFKKYEAKLREVFAQDPSNKVLNDHYVNTVPIFSGHENQLKIHARQLDSETEETKEKYMFQISDELRRKDNSPAIVNSLKDFKTNFNLFSESSLVDLDWSNVVAAGSSVVTALLPVSEEHGSTKRALREYYHEKLAPASDVDLFLYGLNEEEAIKKITQIEASIRDSILHETTTIRTKNAITIVSQYPTRHVQIVLRLYKSVSEILTGFDVDCSCVAFDGSQVYATPRAIAAYMTQINSIDLTRRSPSYENRLSKYSHRGFEVFWSALDRSRIDPTIFERNLSRMVGLARILVVEKLPKPDDRDAYLAKRRAERGRPELPYSYRYRNRNRLHGNIKEDAPDDVPEWVDEEDVSNYHTFSIPYGPRFTAKRIERLLYTKDLLLNAEWNKPDDREVHLHRHPAFFGFVEDVIHDCCGDCPNPVTDEEKEAAEEESKTFISGEIQFIKDDPGRQAIGSFHPITADDWTEMAYVGNTTRLCQAIVDKDFEHVQDWCGQEGVDVNRRDHTGRTPLHLATMCSSPEIVKYLIDNGARMISRLYDGSTALHIAAREGNVEMVKALLEKSEANEEEEERKHEEKKAAKKAEKVSIKENEGTTNTGDESDDDASIIIDDSSSDESHTMTEGSFVKVKSEVEQATTIPDDNQDEPDVFDVNVLAWDNPFSPLHLAILGGHLEVIDKLVMEFGADVLLPVKIIDAYSRNPKAAILTIILALQIPLERCVEVVKKLIGLGATSSQADMNQASVLHYVVSNNATEVLDLLFELDEPAAKAALNHLSVKGWQHNPSVNNPLLTAIGNENVAMVDTLLKYGAEVSIGFEPFMRAWERQFDQATSSDVEQNKKMWSSNVEQPIIVAVASDNVPIIRKLLEHGADPNTLTKGCAQDYLRSTTLARGSLLDVVIHKLESMKEYDGKKVYIRAEALESDEVYLEGLKEGSYKRALFETELAQAKLVHKTYSEGLEEELSHPKEEPGLQEKKAKIESLRHEFEELRKDLIKRGAKTLSELYPPKIQPEPSNLHFSPNREVEKNPWKPSFSFKVGNLTDTTKQGYLELAYTRLRFEAAWAGDLQTIKSLTLSFWGPEKKNLPLKIAASDTAGFNPFSIAVFRRHYNVAKAVLEIAEAQYQPHGDQRYRYEMASPYDSDDDSAYTDNENDDEIHVYAQLVDDRFTITDIGNVGDSVKSHIKPSSLLTEPAQFVKFLKTDAYLNIPTLKGVYQRFGIGNDFWTQFRNIVTNQCAQRERFTLFRYAIIQNDMHLLKFLLQIGAESANREKDENGSNIFSVPITDFQTAIDLGRTEMCGEIIKRSGAGIPLQALVNTSGAKVVQEKPQYYQGLNVYGKKRKDWADAGRGTVSRRIENQTPPAVDAIFSGNIDSTEWYLSEAPLRKYSEFAKSHKGDKRIQALAEVEGGIEKALSSWLSSQDKLALHIAVMASSQDNTTDLVKLVFHHFPDTINNKTVQGLTPLHLALSLRKVSHVKFLVDAGATQTLRDACGRNLIHFMLVEYKQPNYASTGSFLNSPDMFEKLISLLDERLVETMFTERCGKIGPGALTPLALWLDRHDYCFPRCEDILRLILKYGKGHDLRTMNGAGDYPLHMAVKKGLHKLCKIMVEFDPSLLYQENSTGMTPLEVAQNAYLRRVVSNPPGIDHRSFDNIQPIATRHPSKFLPTTESTNENVEMWRLLRQKADENPGKRKLVSLHDANEVAKRLAKKQKQMVCETDEVDLFKLPFQLFHERWFAKSKSPFVQQATLFQDIVIRCVRYAFANVPANVCRVSLSKPVSCRFLKYRIFRHLYFWPFESLDPFTLERIEKNEFRGLLIDGSVKPDIIIYYIHGGGFSLGSPYFYLEFLLAWLHLLQQVGFRSPCIFALEYDLVPDKTYPTQPEQAVAGYKYLISEIANKESDKIYVAGDSAGATLVLNLLLLIDNSQRVEENSRSPKLSRRTPLQKPRGCILISPWVTLISQKHQNTTSDYLDTNELHEYARKYISGNYEKMPLISPGRPENDEKWNDAMPSIPIFVIYGSEEVFAPEIRSWIGRLRRDQNIRVSEWQEQGQIHAWPVAALFLGNSRLQRLGGLRLIVNGIASHYNIGGEVGYGEDERLIRKLFQGLLVFFLWTISLHRTREKRPDDV